MDRRQVRGLAVVAVLLALVVLTAAIAGAQQGPASAAHTIIAANLNAPRHLAFGADGALYVAEAGAGGELCVPGERGENCIGESGAVTRVDQGMQERVVDDLVSLLTTADGQSEATGPHDVAWDNGGNLMVIVGLGANPNVRDPNGALGPLSENLGQLVQVAADGTWANVVDVAAYEAAENPDGGEIDSNPYGLERIDGGYLVADAGANALLHVTDNGDISTVAVFPDRMVEFPPGSGQMMPMQAVPTSVVVGPDGAYYVSQLTGFPFPPGGANIYRVVEGEAPEVYATGFTNIVDIAFDEDGYLYVVEIAKNGLLSGDPTGAVIRVDDDHNQVELANLFMPGGVAVGDDGMLYVTTGTPGGMPGGVVRLSAQPVVLLPVVAGGSGQ